MQLSLILLTTTWVIGSMKLCDCVGLHFVASIMNQKILNTLRRYGYQKRLCPSSRCEHTSLDPYVLTYRKLDVILTVSFSYDRAWALIITTTHIKDTFEL